MLEKIIKKDKNEELERILEEKKVDEQAKNLLQGILYKIEISYKDYKKAKVTDLTEKQYVDEILRNIQRGCNKIDIIKLSQKLEDEKLQKELEKNKFYIKENEILSYPIEEKILYAIEKNTNNKKIVNNKYGIIKIPLSNMINTGRCIDKVEVLRDFNGYSWTTIKKEIENIRANLIYQTLRILLGEDFLDGWTNDIDGIIDYIQILKEEIEKEYGKEVEKIFIERLYKIAIINEIEENEEYKEKINDILKQTNEKLSELQNTKEYIQKITNFKKEATEKIKKIEKILSQESKLREEYEKRNEGVELQNKIFSIRVLKQQLEDEKRKLLNEIDEKNYYLNPMNYVEEKEKVRKEKELLEVIEYTENQKEEALIAFEKTCLKCFEKMLERPEQQDIIKLIYKFRYFMLLPFDEQKSIKNINELSEEINIIKKKILDIAIQKKVISKIPIEILSHVLETRIIKLEELYYNLTIENNKKYIQIFDENITEEKFEINKIDKIKINKKLKIFL